MRKVSSNAQSHLCLQQKQLCNFVTGELQRNTVHLVKYWKISLSNFRPKLMAPCARGALGYLKAGKIARNDIQMESSVVGDD